MLRIAVCIPEVDCIVIDVYHLLILHSILTVAPLYSDNECNGHKAGSAMDDALGEEGVVTGVVFEDLKDSGKGVAGRGRGK